MASFEPVVVLFGSSTSIAAVKLQLPVSFVFAIDAATLENLVSVDPQLCDTCLQRYFLLLLDSIDPEQLNRFQANHRVQNIYMRHTPSDTNPWKLRRIGNSSQQLTLDLTRDIVHFLTAEGVKQAKLERISLVKLYYRQARFLKEWAMTFVKAEPCHVLLIPLNTSRENLDSAQEQIQNICTKLGYASTVIRILSDYIPSDEMQPSLLPYAKLVFNYDDPEHSCELIKKLSPIRLYLYGNEPLIESEWSKLMIATETEIMEDEDNWCTFIENQSIDKKIKWNFGLTFGQHWQVRPLTPLALPEFNANLRFHSALRRAHLTFSRRQIEVTTRVFDWYDQCVEQGYLQLEPKLTLEQAAKKQRSKAEADLLSRCTFRHLSSFDYSLTRHCSKTKSVSFIWLDEILCVSDNHLDEIIAPFQWQFVNSVSQCVPLIESQLREQRSIFLIASGSLGNELFLTAFRLMAQVHVVYIFCAELASHSNWTRYYSHIRGVYNDSRILADQIKRDFDRLCLSWGIRANTSINTTDRTKVWHKTDNPETVFSLPLAVYNREEAEKFLAHQRTIDTLLCMPHTDQSRDEMIAQFRRIYSDNETALADIHNFELSYHSNAALQWYTRDSFLCRSIMQTLRSSDVDAMFKLRYILIDIYTQLDQIHKQNQSFYLWPTEETLFRGQLMSIKELDYFKQLQGDIVLIKTFFSTTKSMQIAMMFASKIYDNPDLISVVFSITTNPEARHTRPYANISSYSMFQDEDEVLFAMGSIFRIENITKLTNADTVWIIHLTMIDQTDLDRN